MEKIWHKYYDKDVLTTTDYPKKPLKELFNACAKKFPDRAYLIMDKISLSYATCNAMARKFANGLTELGLKKGDRLALVAPNVPQWVIARQACYKLGVIAVPINPFAALPEMEHYFSDSGAFAAVVFSPFASVPVQILNQKNTPLKQIIMIEPSPPSSTAQSQKGIIDFDVLTHSHSDDEPDTVVSWDDCAVLQYTGGTTGISKGCVLTNYNLLAMAIQTENWFRPLFPKDVIRTLAAIPLYHVFGFNMNVNVNMLTGGSIVLVPQPSPDNLIEAINQHEPNLFAAVPTMIVGLNQHPQTPKSKIGSIKGVVSGGAPLAIEALNKFEQLSKSKIIEGYGLSEVSNVVCANPIHTKRKPGSIGIPWQNVDIRIMDLETGTQRMPAGEAGELITKSPTLMKEYWNRPDETGLAIRDGWLYTGDVAYMDGDGYLFIVDRIKDMILSSGFNVYPREIDEVIYTHPKVVHSCTVGVPDDKRGEIAKAFVVTKPGENISEQEIIDYCRQRLTPYKIPKMVEFINELPMTSVGKADRKVLRVRIGFKIT